ncbi:hypothetical protein BpHYR1_005737 [Brachionus plicatilis]|uniref:Uncharacterized protein n=1 Tax=Brachionus plicatilis TaxID=10195 RepID=A0A3M7S1L8_BRAPC|nr:hypothetical protein BpHYR1_005737 [Brachionus plicatilis]
MVKIDRIKNIGVIKNYGTDSTDTISNLASNESIYELAGVCSLLVSFPSSFKLKYVRKLFVYDLMRSFSSRVRLLVEDLDASKDIIGDVPLEEPNANDPSSIEESYQTPNRIQIHLDEQNGQMITDYMFPDEKDLDISERIKDLFSCELVDTKKQIVYLEDLPPEIKTGQVQDLDQESSSRKSSLCSQISSQNEKIKESSKLRFFNGCIGAKIFAML